LFLEAKELAMVGPEATESVYERMGREWLGLGNLDSPIWFVGMEPGGTEDPAWSEIWATKFKGATVVDLHESATPKELPFIGSSNRLHPTWSPIVRCRLAYGEEQPTDEDVLAYMRGPFCRGEGGEALLEVSGYAAASINIDSPRDRFIGDRLSAIADLVRDREPEVVVCYGTSYRKYYRKIAGDFDNNGFRWAGQTLLAFTIHPTPRYRVAPPPEHWTKLGMEMRRRVSERSR